MQESREIIKNRMLTTAAQLWGYPGVENEAAFDPMVGMLINACATEIEKIAREKNLSQVTLMEELARLLTPDADTGALPAHAIACATPEQATAFVDAQQEWTLHRKEADGAPVQETMFSPAARFLLSRCSVKYMAVHNTLFHIIDQRYKQAAAQTLPAQPLPHNCLYIGLEADMTTGELPELSLFFDSQPDQPLREHLQHARWSVAGHPVTSGAGFASRINDPGTTLLNSIQQKYTANERYCRYVLHYYEQQFVTLYQLPLQERAVPEALLSAFPDAAMRNIPNNILWLQATFPHYVPQASLYNSIVLNNCFPVLNRRAHHFMYRLQPHLNILPIRCNDLFFDIKRVYDERGKSYDLHLQATADRLPEDTVTLRTKGVNRFDTRDAAELVLHLAETLKDEVAAYAALGVDAVAGALQELNAVIDNLEEKTGHVHPQEPFSYLLMRGREDSGNLFVECWSTTGAAANGIKPGTLLEAVRGIDLLEKRAVLITPASGGRNRLTAEEKLLAYKQALLSAGRLVTAEDIKTFCIAALGQRITAVEIRHGVQAGATGKEGLVRTIDIILTPAPGAAGTDWEPLLEELHRKITFQAAGTYPYRVKLQELPAFNVHSPF